MADSDRQIYITRGSLEELHAAILKVEQHVCAVDAKGRQVARHTKLVIQVVLYLFLLSTVVTFVMLYSFAGKMKSVVSNMVEMYERFDTMSKDMDAITKAVVNMRHSTVGIPDIAIDMETMNVNVARMSDNVGTMTSNIVEMDGNMASIGVDVHHMADRFDHLTHTVHGMRHDVNQMSAPVRGWNWPFSFPK